MKKNVFKIILIIILAVIFIAGILGYQKYKENKRYEEIIKDFEKLDESAKLVLEENSSSIY